MHLVQSKPETNGVFVNFELNYQRIYLSHGTNAPSPFVCVFQFSFSSIRYPTIVVPGRFSHCIPTPISRPLSFCTPSSPFPFIPSSSLCFPLLIMYVFDYRFLVCLPCRLICWVQIFRGNFQKGSFVKYFATRKQSIGTGTGGRR